ncbi:MAG: hypothetical protein AAFR38_07020 [Planctomycetota bacterium]
MPNKIYNAERSEYLVELDTADEEVGVDLAVIEFDEFGMYWDREQLEDTLRLIERRNAESERGIVVWTYTHGWQNNANPKPDENDLARFREQIRETSERLSRINRLGGLVGIGSLQPDHVVGVYLGWRGATSNFPVHKFSTFWERLRVAERVASYSMLETMFRLTAAAKARPDSKVLITGHSMGGMIVAKTLARPLVTTLMTRGLEGFELDADLILLENPALDALSSMQVIEYLKRFGTVAELRYSDGRVEPAPGPVMVSITSEVDAVTKNAYQFGRVLGTFGTAFRRDRLEGGPSQQQLARRSEGHVDFLVSHRAWIEDGELRLEAVPGAFNDTPYWVVQVTEDICASHGDIWNDRYRALIRRMLELNRIYDTDVETWVRTTRTLGEG